MRKNRNLVQAQVPVQASVFHSLPNGRDEHTLLREVTEAMNRTAAERHRRVFESPRIIALIESDGVVTVTYEAFTEPA